MDDEDSGEEVQAKYLKILYKDDYDGLDANNRLDNDDIEMAIKGIDRDIKILGDRVAKYFDFDHFNEKFQTLLLDWGPRLKHSVYSRSKVSQ